MKSKSTATQVPSSSSLAPDPPVGVLDRHRLFITGAASGIGAGLATRLAADGASIALCGHPGQVERLESVEAAVHALGGTAVVTIADVRDEEQVNRAVSGCVDAFGGVDGRSPVPVKERAGLRSHSTLTAVNSQPWWRPT